MDWLKLLQRANVSSVAGVNDLVAATIAQFPRVRQYVESVKLAPADTGELVDATLVVPLPGVNVVAVKLNEPYHTGVKFAANFLGHLPARDGDAPIALVDEAPAKKGKKA